MSFKVSSSMHDPEIKKSGVKSETPEKKPGSLSVKASKENIKSSAVPAKETPPEEKTQETIPGKPQPWLTRTLWGAAGAMVLILVFLTLQFFGVIPAKKPKATETTTASVQALPAFTASKQSLLLMRLANPTTTIPERTNQHVVTYTVEKGDSIFGIAREYKVEPESVLWANMKTLQGDPQMISVGLNLNIPPVDGVYYQWKDGDTLDAVAGKYKVDPQAIILWPGNDLDLTNPVIEPGQYIMIPGGKGEFKEWVVPIPYKARSGTTSSISDQCTIAPGMYWGTGTFIWPTVSSFISGNDYWDGHRGIDIGSNEGDPVWASDSGVVVQAGQMSGGYGIVVIIEHDTTLHTFHTVYAHLNAVAVSCGQIVNQGQTIGYSGTTGNSTGPHLHFEIREDGGFVNPHYLLGM